MGRAGTELQTPGRNIRSERSAVTNCIPSIICIRRIVARYVPESLYPHAEEEYLEWT